MKIAIRDYSGWSSFWLEMETMNVRHEGERESAKKIEKEQALK